MKTTLGKKTRLLALAALIAVLPLGIWACEDSGDGPDGPTGPATQYNPQMDYPEATISAKVNTSPVAPGAIFGIVATFKDANGLPVEGVPLAIVAEDGGAKNYFSFETNPTLTDGSGKASINVVVSGTCPNGSYRFTIAPLWGAQVRGYVGVVVSGVGAAASVTSVTLTGNPATTTVGNSVTFTATTSATTGCDVRYLYNAAGGGLNTGWSAAADTTSNLFTQTPTAQGTLTFLVRAYCEATPAVVVESNSVNITVNP